MNYSIIRYILGTVLSVEGVLLLVPTLVAVFYQEQQGFVYALVACLCMIGGFVIRLSKPKSYVFFSKEGYAAVSLSWILLSVVGAMPFVLTGEIPSFTDALFETISGFTTTGASILSDVEMLSRTTAFWRCFTHWVGGMGVLVFIMAVLPLAGTSSMHLMKAESPGPSVGKLVPKMRSTAMILYGIYVMITLTEIVALLLAGMSLYESMTLSFATVGTGGFALLNSSIASYHLSVQIIIIAFMLICAINFNVYYLFLIRKPKDALKSEEVRTFLIIVFASAGLIAFNIRDMFASGFEAFHTALFQVVSIISTTGFATADYNLWPAFSQSLLAVLMLLGACAGSTGGGFKVSRMLILFKSIKNELLSVIHPRSMQKVHMDGRRVPDTIVKTVMAYFAIYIMLIILSILIISLDGFDFATNVTAVFSCVNNIGPGLNVVGPTGNFGAYSNLSKLVLMIDMLTGRLELFPMFVLVTPGVWRLPQRR